MRIDRSFHPARSVWHRARIVVEGVGWTTAAGTGATVITGGSPRMIGDSIQLTAMTSSTLSHWLSHPPSGTLASEVALSLAAAGAVGLVGVRGWRWRNETRTGMASRSELDAAMTPAALRRKLPIVRPATAGALTRRQLRALPLTETGIVVGRVDGGIGARPPVLTSFEDVTALIAPPRAGKSSLLAGQIIDFPGSVLASSTRLDLYTYTARLRARRGKVWLFNPEQVGGVASNFRINPVDGCENPNEARMRAGYLLSGGPGAAGTTNRDFWQGNTFSLLWLYLHAAAVAGLTLRQVWQWSGNPGDATPVRILGDHPDATPGAANALDAILKLPMQTRDSIFQTLRMTLDFMASPAVLEATTPSEAYPALDFDKFLDGSNTLYLVADYREYGSIAPLMTCITGMFFERAKTIAAGRPGARLDPPCGLFLDETCNANPVPLERWSTVAGGWGLPVSFTLQSMSQLRRRYGSDAARIIFDAAAVKIAFGGLSDPEDLEALSTIAGTHPVTRTSTTHGANGQTSSHTLTEDKPIMLPHEIRKLKEGRVLVLHRVSSPVIARYTSVWKRRDVKPILREQTVNGVTTPPLPDDLNTDAAGGWDETWGEDQ